MSGSVALLFAWLWFGDAQAVKAKPALPELDGTPQSAEQAAACARYLRLRLRADARWKEGKKAYEKEKYRQAARHFSASSRLLERAGDQIETPQDCYEPAPTQ